ncbi:MAG: type 4a pilus biogenesis protein PilO, partial [Syntrophorhabdaceae bacterium]|nr:type 4a pilus biogenesis protein PilO [Syntrophorhabdaceae bacterium]
VLISAFVLVGYYYLFYKDMMADIAILENQLGTLQAKINEHKTITQDLEAYREEVQQLDAQLTLLLEQLPNSAEIPSLLKNISDLGKEAGLDFLKFAPAKEVLKGFYAEIPVAITVSGDYHSFAQFADQVSKYPRIVNLLNIDFTGPKAARGGFVRSTVSCTATTYRFVEEPVGQAINPNEKGHR